MDKHDPDAIQHLGERHDIAWILDNIAAEKTATARAETELQVEKNLGEVLPVKEKTPLGIVNGAKKPSFSVRSKSRLARFLRIQ